VIRWDEVGPQALARRLARKRRLEQRARELDADAPVADRFGRPSIRVVDRRFERNGSG
jgi:hypothetical protein